jgi:AcrR family transcriptional regulator
MTVRREPRQRRGDELRRHILLVAKDVFLETGYERASMDTVAARSGTSKRSLYAHFETKEMLFRAVLDLIKELYLVQLRTPEAYAGEPREAVALFCGRFQQLMTWDAQVRTCRLGIAEAERLRDGAKTYFDAVFGSAYQRLADYLAERGSMDHAAALAAAEDLLGRAVLPRLFRLLLGVEEPAKARPDEASLAEDVDLPAIRGLVSSSVPGL